MNYIKVAVFSVFGLSVCVSSALGQSAATLAEKIALARHLADEAASGKAEEGRVLTGNFDFNAELKKFRALNKTFVSDESIPEESDITQKGGKNLAADAKPEIPRKTEAEPVVRPAPTAETQDMTESAKPKSPAKDSRHVVDTSKNFVNGYFIGTIDDGKNLKEAEELQKKLAENEKKSKEKSKILSYNGRIFHLDTDNFVFHSTMVSMVDECEAVLDSYFGTGDKKPFLANKIWLRVTDDKNLKISGHTLTFAENGDATLTFKYDENLRLEDFCSALVDCALRKLAFERGGLEASKKVPLWLKMSIACSLEQNVRFGVSVDLAQFCADNPVPAPAAVFSFAKVGDVSAAQSYLSLVAIGKASPDRASLSRFMYFALAATPPEKLSQMLADFKPRNYDFDLWWRCLVTGETYARIGGVLSPRRSADEIARLAVLQTNTKDGERTGVPLDRLLSAREYIAEDIKLRLLEIKVAFTNINPVYHNALIALGQIFEAAQDGDESDFIEAKSRFLAEFKLASELSSQVENMMRK